MTEGRGAVSDLSLTGCFVLSGGEISAGELIRLQITFPRDVEIVWGQVVYVVAEIGFALRFVFQDQADKREFEKLIGTLK